LLQLVGACHGPFYCWTQLDSPVFSKLFFNRNFGQRLMGCKFNVWEHDLESWDVSQSSQIPQLDPRIFSYNIHIFIYIYSKQSWFPVGTCLHSRCIFHMWKFAGG
jgi:hypothetical protein